MEVHDQSGDADNRYKPRKQVRSKIPIQIYVITVMHILLSKEKLLLKEEIMRIDEIGL